MKKDIEIAQEARIRPIVEIAEKLGIPPDELELYGRYKAKIPLHFIDEEHINKSKLILVTAITPTPAGEGKTTTSLGLAQGLNLLKKKQLLSCVNHLIRLKGLDSETWLSVSQKHKNRFLMTLVKKGDHEDSPLRSGKLSWHRVQDLLYRSQVR